MDSPIERSCQSLPARRMLVGPRSVALGTWRWSWLSLFLFSHLACTPTPPTESANATADNQVTEQGDLDEDGRLITAPTKGSPEAVIQTVLAASVNENAEMGWDTLLSVLHSGNKGARALKDWKSMKYPASRRKVGLFLEDPRRLHFRVMRTETPNPETIRLFVRNAKSLPTPCELRRDPEAGDAWRVWVCSL